MGSSGQQFNLRWNNHTANILQVFMDNLNTEALVDVTLSCEGKFIKAHKMVLSACSPYFQELFSLHQLPHPIIILNGVVFDELKLVVEFMYKGEIKVLENDLQRVLQTAETLQIKGLCTVRKKYNGTAAAAAAVAQTLGQQKQSHPLNKIRLLPTALVAANENIGHLNGHSHQDDGVEEKMSSGCETVSGITDGGETFLGFSDSDNIAATDKIGSRNISVNKSVEPKGVHMKTALKRLMEDAFKISNGSTGTVHHQLSKMTSSLLTKASGASERNDGDSTRNRRISSSKDLDEDNCGNDNNFKPEEDFDDELLATIKVEPLDIKDIDGDTSLSDDCTGCGPPLSPKLIIDEPSDENENEFPPLKKVRKVCKPEIPMQCILPDVSYNHNRSIMLSYKDDPLSVKSAASIKRQHAFEKSGKIPRPPNAFMIFANEWRKVLSRQHPLENNKDISVRLGMMWKNLDTDDKERYYSASRKADEDHKKKYPGYYYSPKEARLRKTLKNKAKINSIKKRRGSDIGSFITEDRSRSSSPASSSCADDLPFVKDVLSKNDRVESLLPIVLLNKNKTELHLLGRRIAPGMDNDTDNSEEDPLKLDVEIEDVGNKDSKKDKV